MTKVTVVGIQREKKPSSDNLKRNFGQPHPEGYRGLAAMKQAEKFGCPVVTRSRRVLTPGVGAEERGQGEATSET